VFTGTHLTQKARRGNSAVRIKDGSSNFLFWGYKGSSGDTKWGQLQATPFRFVSMIATSLKFKSNQQRIINLNYRIMIVL
jgi:hypothetical protein